MIECLDFGDMEQRIALIDDGQCGMPDDDPVQRAHEAFRIFAEQATDLGEQVALAHHVARFADTPRDAAPRRAHPARSVRAQRHLDLVEPVVRGNHPDMREDAQHARYADADREPVEPKRFARFQQQHGCFAVGRQCAHRARA